jgi:methyl-accepting chemotaxis protein
VLHQKETHVATHERKRRSLRTTLLYAFVAMTLLPALVAAVSGYLSIDATMREQSRSIVLEHGRVAGSLVDDRMTAQRNALTLIAKDRDVVGDTTGGEAASYRLRDSLKTTGFDYLLLLAASGRGLASSGLTENVDRRADALIDTAGGGNAASSFQVISRTELDAVDLGGRGELALVETKGGAKPAAPIGSLALVSAVPVRDAKGTVRAVLVGVEVLNRSTSLVDTIAERLGGTATVFQGVVRISTTVKNPQGARAIGTWASDAVQAAYEAKSSFVGEALVVGSRYMTDYEPLRGFDGRQIGMLYVGIPLDPYTQARNTFLLRLFVALAACVAIAVLAAAPIAKWLVEPVTKVGEAAEHVAAGDLRTEVPLSGTAELVRLGESFNRMTGSLSRMISDVRHAVEGLREASTSILSSSEQQAQTVTRQVAAATETTATLEEMATSYRAVAMSAEEVRRIAEDALEAARDGQATLEESIAAADDLHRTAGSTSESAREVEDVSERIGEVLVLIDSIAEQTKILALNAAIEAARAGDAGKGFSVVASEIRSLATSVGRSTAQIEEMVDGIRAATTKLTKTAEQQAVLSEKGSALGHRASDAFNDILEQLSATTGAAREIAVAAQQQRSAAEQVFLAMQQVTVAASESSQAADELARAARAVDDHGRTLESGIEGFRL